MRAFLVAVALLLVFPFAARAVPPAAPPTMVVSEAEVRKVITDFVKQKTEALSAQVTIRRIGYSGDLKLPAGKVTYEVMAPERWEGYGNTSLSLIVRVDDQVKKNVTVQVEVEALAQMLVATRPLERGEVISASDVAVDRRDLARVQGPYMTAPAEAIGLRTKMSLRANAPIRSDFLERVPVIKSGQLVTILLENEVMKITVTGRAKQSGAVGDLIMVQNISSQKELAARVVDATTVKVDF